MERFTPLYAIAYAITKSMENLRFDKEGYFHVLVFYGLFYKRNRKHFPPCSHTLIETLVEVWENSKLRGNSRPTGSCSHFNFSFSQTSTRVSITVWKHGKCFLFLKYNNRRPLLHKGIFIQPFSPWERKLSHSHTD